MDNADVIVIGSGQGGLPLAEDLAKRGKRVVVFERGQVGGSCINYGCTPSKAFLAAAHNAGRARRAKNLGVKATVDVDFPFVMNRLRDIVKKFREHDEQRLIDAGVKLVRAEASFSGKRVVRGGDTEVTAPIVVINTGTSPAIPDVPGLKETPFLTNTSFFSQTSLPARFLAIGGGYIGLELGQGMARCGSRVDIIHNGDRLLQNEEPKVSELLRESLEEDGAGIHVSAEIAGVHYTNGVFTLELKDGTTFDAEQLLVATGRKPNTGALNVKASGIELDERGYVKIDPQFHTSCDGVYAIGDVSGQPAFTHVSWEDYRRMLSILDGGTRTRDDRVLGYAVYTEPQVGRAGMTYEQARTKGVNARCEEISLDEVARAIEWGEERGFYRMVVDRGTEKILGATLVGYEAAELIHVFIAHMQCGSTWRELDNSVHIHPTYAEGFPTLARLFEDEPTPLLHTARLDLEPVRALHAEEAWPLVDDARMWTYFPEKRPQTFADLRRLYQKWADGSPDSGEIWHNWMCRERETSKLVGGVQATVVPQERLAYMAYAIYPAFQRKGYAREASLALIEYVTQISGVERIYTEMDVKNEASYRLAESLGFERVEELSGEFRYELRLRR